MKRRAFLFCGAAAAGAFSQAKAEDALDAAAVESFVVEMATAHDFDAAALRALFAQMRVDEKVVELMDAPRDPTKKTYWREYRARHLKPWIVAGGEDFLRRHRAAFARAEKKFGVPRHIAAAILGIETRFGGYLGNFSTAQALSTLAFAYPRRATFFRGELAEFLLYARENGIDPLALRGSFAGAFGIPQFLPSNARRFAVDFDGDGKVDLFSPVDALGSAANFLVAHGWRRGLAVSHRFAAVGDTADFEAAGIKPAFVAADFAAAGFRFAAPPPPTQKLALVELENRDGDEHRAGTENYYALTRYNRSNKYAMSVEDLAAALSAREN